jgi:hypothetical protein
MCFVFCYERTNAHLLFALLVATQNVHMSLLATYSKSMHVTHAAHPPDRLSRFLTRFIFEMVGAVT